MARSYYYTLASLPSLQPDDAPPFDRDYFLQLCENTLHKKDFAELQESTMELPVSLTELKGLNRTYWNWETALRNSLVKARAKQWDLEGGPFLRPGDSFAGTEEIAQHALRQETPLEAERYLSKQRWEFLESLRVAEYFSFNNLQIWYLQYQILERLALFQEEEGFRNYRELYEDILKGQEESSQVNEVNK